MDSPIQQRRPPQFSIGCLLLTTTILAVPITLLSGWNFQRIALIAETKRKETENKFTLKQVVIDIEGLCTELGFALKDQEELEYLMGEPLPVLHEVSTVPVRISYKQTGKSSFVLRFAFFGTGDWSYDSTTHQAGWVNRFINTN